MIIEKYNQLSEYYIEKYWEPFLSGCEKKVLQSFRKDIVAAYILTKEERQAIMFINSIKIEGKSLSLLNRR